jgi:hypothetical protein
VAAQSRDTARVAQRPVFTRHDAVVASALIAGAVAPMIS